MGQDQSSVFDLAAVAAASNGGNNDPLLPPARYIGAPQKPSKMPYNKYVAYDKQVPFDFPERTWPGKRLQRAPRWCSVDLRDGNQALVNPMDSERKLRFWNLLVSMGFKEIEVGFPAASETEYEFLRALIEQGESELVYLDTVFDELARASLESELNAIREELAAQGYVRRAARRGMKEERLAPLRFVSDDGFTILCGRNNLQNDRLTLKDSRKNDIWLHTQKIPGSHVVIVTQGQEVPDRTLEQAAVIAAYHSKARESGKVAVDYTQVRNVWKHPSGRPGLVLYEPYQTAIVEPDAALADRLLEKQHGQS